MFRFGVSGSREYVRALSAAERELIEAAVSVDSVGEGRLYIPDSSLGATFARAFLPLAGHERLNDLLQEAAHLHGIKFNTYLAGGTTDHISFLEAGRPGAALVALSRGKASPLVLGGKIHTSNDTADRVYPEPLSQSLRILDTWFHLMQGGERLAEPRELDEFHYARLYRVRLRDAGEGQDASGGPREEWWLALKDAIEPNRRHLNAVYRVEAEIADDRARCRVIGIVGWGVETGLQREVSDLAAARGDCERAGVRVIELATPAGGVTFALRAHPRWSAVRAAGQRLRGWLESLIGTHSFLTFFPDGVPAGPRRGGRARPGLPLGRVPAGVLRLVLGHGSGRAGGADGHRRLAGGHEAARHGRQQLQAPQPGGQPRQPAPRLAALES